MEASGAGAGEVRHWNADVNGISLHVAEHGPVVGPAVLLIHGFPELWFSWRHQMAARGFRALAPGLRGYGDSEAPADPVAYTIFHLVRDIAALLDHLRLHKISLKQMQDLIADIRKEYANFEKAIEFSNDKAGIIEDCGCENGHISSHTNMQTEDQRRNVLQMLEQSIASELDLEKNLSDSRSTVEEVKLELCHQEQETYFL